MEQLEMYLGDGVYASWDGYHIILKTSSGLQTNTIYLDSSVADSLESFRAHIKETLKTEDSE